MTLSQTPDRNLTLQSGERVVDSFGFYPNEVVITRKSLDRDLSMTVIYDDLQYNQLRPSLDQHLEDEWNQDDPFV